MTRLFLALAAAAALAVPALAQDAQKAGEAPQKEDSILIPKDSYRTIENKLAERGVVMAPSGAKSADDLKKFQRESGLEDTGKLDVPTIDKLGFSMIVAVSPKVDGAHLLLAQQPKDTQLPAGFPSGTPVVGGGREPVGVVYLGDGAIRKIYRRLVADGHLQTNLFERGAALIDPGITPEFVDALKRFQTAHAIQPANGVLDTKTLAEFKNLDLAVEISDRGGMERGESGGAK